MLAEQLWREVDLADIRYVLELQLLVELDLQLRFQVVCAEIEFDLRVLVACDGLLFVDDRVGEAWVERVFEDALMFAVAAWAVQIEVEALIGAGDPYIVSASTLEAALRYVRPHSIEHKDRVASLTVVEIHGHFARVTEAECRRGGESLGRWIAAVRRVTS